MQQFAEWIFGYGSLIWRADFPFARKQPAYIKNWSRKFWQGSTDHRGVPSSPGRVVTLVEAADKICWGMAYCLQTGSRTSVMTALDHREKGGYDQLTLPMFFENGTTVQCTTYIALPGNPNFLGEADLPVMARQIRNANGPSGSNREYLFRLESALAELSTDASAQDLHVTDIANMVRSLPAS